MECDEQIIGVIMEIRAIVKDQAGEPDRENADTWVNGIEQSDSEVFATARLLSRFPEYVWTEVWSNGERVRVYVKGHNVLSNG
jgi:hypothetical protein